MLDVTGHDGCIPLNGDLGKTSNNTIIKGKLEQCSHLTMVQVNVSLKPNLEETKICIQYANMTESIILPLKQ